MSRTTFTGPLATGEDTGVVSTNTIAYVPVVKQTTVAQGASESSVTIPPSTIKKLGFVPTSAFTGGDSVTSMNVTFSDGTIVLGVLQASAASRYVETTVVSGAAIGSASTSTVALSAVSTMTFTGGGGRAFIEYLVVE